MTIVDEHLQKVPAYSPPSFTPTYPASPVASSSYPSLRHTNYGPRLLPRVTSTPWDHDNYLYPRINRLLSTAYRTFMELDTQLLTSRTGDNQFNVLIEKQCNLTRCLCNKTNAVSFHASGDPTEYNIFIEAFNSQFHLKLDCNSDRLRYLNQYLEGETKELIKLMDATICIQTRDM